MIALCLVLRQVPCLRSRSALVPRAKRSESRNNRKYAWQVSPPRGSLANSDPIVNIPHGLKTAMPARRFRPPWSIDEWEACFVVIDSAALYLLPHQLNMPPMRPPVSNALFCLASKVS